MRLRAIIFEDDPEVRHSLWSLFDWRGYEVFTYPDPGLCPLSVVSQCPCTAGALCADVIISDIQMPATNGIDFMERLINKGCRGPHFALMSGSWLDGDFERATRLGCKLFSKPFDVSLLTEWLDQVEPAVSQDRRLFNWHLSQPVVSL